MKVYVCFPEGKAKALTMSYDDGKIQDYGGGEGRNFGKHPVTPWGVQTKGKKTRHNKRTDKFIVRRRGK